MGIIDYVIIGAAVLFLIIGLILGLRKMLFGIVSAIVAIVLAAVVMMPLGNAVMNGTNWDEALTDSLAKSFSSSMPNGNQTLVYADADGDPQTKDELGFFVDGTWHPFADSLEGSALANVSTTVESNVRSLYPQDKATENPKTCVLIISESLTRIIFYAAAFILLWIAFGVAFWAISHLLKQFVNGTYAGKVVDKVLGAAVGVAIVWVISMLVFAVFDILEAVPQTAGFMAKVTEMIDNSTIASFIVKNNFIAQLIDVDKIVASFGGAA